MFQDSFLLQRDLKRKLLYLSNHLKFLLLNDIYRHDNYRVNLFMKGQIKKNNNEEE